MPKLAAIFIEPETNKPETRWEEDFTADAPVVLGRSNRSDWVADWEGVLSRRHARLSYARGHLSVEILPEATNPLIFQGKPYPGGTSFQLHPGERFSVGRTIFEYRDEQETVALDGPTPTESKTIRASDLDRVAFLDADRRIDALAEFHSAIRDASDEAAFDDEVLKVLLKGIPQADAAALVTMAPRDAASTDVGVAATRSRIDAAKDFQPSRKLIVEAIHTRKDPVVHTWDTSGSGLVPPSAIGDSAGASGHRFDWAYCVPVPYFGTDRWGLYLAGRFPSRLNRPAETEDDQQINRDVKFTGLVAKVVASHRRVGYLQHRYDIMARFLSASVRQALGKEEITQVLRQREATVTVLFCDLRGSCKISEENQGNLMGLWTSISAALSIMTSSIIEQNGVIGDFQGDAAMGFWGWPLECPDQVERAAQAALAIRRKFEQVAQEPGHPLKGFACGVGIAHGRAIAGALGTYEQFKVSVYGPPVNLAARLESLTKQFRVPILLDEDAAAKLRGTPFGTRRLARIRPFGLAHEVTISELYLPMVMETLSDDERGDFDVAYEHFLSGEWKVARRKLDDLQHDGASLFLTRFMDDHPSGPPDGWDGVISLKSK
jgi:adenylate cyclase